MNIEYIVLTYMQTPGKWCVTLVTPCGEFTSSVRADSPEKYLTLNFPGVEIKIHDWRTKSWRDDKEEA